MGSEWEAGHKIRSHQGCRLHQAYRTQSTEHKTQNTEHRTQNTEHRTQNTDPRTQQCDLMEILMFEL